MKMNYNYVVSTFFGITGSSSYCPGIFLDGLSETAGNFSQEKPVLVPRCRIRRMFCQKLHRILSTRLSSIHGIEKWFG
jgi:hypothetical protein